jgi:hypothetical protein
MFCNLNDAFCNICDLEQTQQNCVYDNIVNDGVDVKKDHIPKNMFTAQGDYYEYSPMQYSDDVINQTNSILDGEEYDKCANVDNINKNGKDECNNKKCVNKTNCDTVKLNGSDLESINKQILKLSKKQSSDLNVKQIIKDAIKEHFEDEIKKNKKISTKTKFIHNIFNSDIISVFLITFIGLIIILLLDILVRISRKL